MSRGVIFDFSAISSLSLSNSTESTVTRSFFDISSFILKKLGELYPDRLYERYQIKNLSDDLMEEYDLIGKKRGALKRGGLVDYDKVNNIIIQDLKNGHFGKITFDRLTDK